MSNKSSRIASQLPGKLNIPKSPARRIGYLTIFLPDKEDDNGNRSAIKNRLRQLLLVTPACNDRSEQEEFDGRDGAGRMDKLKCLLRHSNPQVKLPIKKGMLGTMDNVRYFV